MKIIISPAKKMKVNTDVFVCEELPCFIEQTEILMCYMKSLDYGECKEIWKCNDSIAQQNFRRFQEMDLHRGLTPAILSYEGIQYQYMAPAVMEEASFVYLQDHLRILSGFYGILKPFDGVAPYRLEMQAKLGGHEANPKLGSLYEFWGDRLASTLFAEENFILNLASKEYSKCISKYLTREVAFVTCVFGELIHDKVVEKGTFAKMARGEMVRFLAETKGESLEQVMRFDRLGYRYSAAYSDEKKLVFLKEDRQEDNDNKRDKEF